MTLWIIVGFFIGLAIGAVAGFVLGVSSIAKLHKMEREDFV